MSDGVSPGAPSAWLNAAHVEHWLQSVWPSWRGDDIRRGADSRGRWFWVVPDYERGRSRVLGIHRNLLEQTPLNKLRTVLENANWEERIDREALLVRRSASGEPVVEPWSPELDEKWFETPKGEHFVAFRKTPAMMKGIPEFDAPKPHLALHGALWSRRGPQDPRPVDTYTLEELLPFTPEGRSEAT
jgi:hypothetical protein